MAGPSEPGLIERAVAGDEVAFAALVGPHQRAVFRHCYRMLGSGADAEDATQDTLERAWRRLATYDGSGPFGAWLQRIATNMCLDGLLAPRQRAALLLHDVLGFTHAEVGEVLGVGSTAVNSLLSRARGSVRAAAGSPPSSISDPRVRQLLGRYVRAWQLADIDGLVRLIAEDVRFSMPPLTAWFQGREAVAAFIENAIFATARPHGIPLQAGSCNGQPVFATYQPDSHGRLAVSGLQVLQVSDVDGQPLITAVASYRDPALAIRCGLPAALP